MDESLLRLDFKRCRVAITGDRHWIDIQSPIQLGADYQRSCSCWVTDAYRPLEVIFLDLRHFPEESQSVRRTRAQAYHQLLVPINTERPTFRPSNLQQRICRKRVERSSLRAMKADSIGQLIM